jgi:hypothetical protein
MLGVNYDGHLGDKRTEKRGAELHHRLFSNSTQSIQRLSQSRSEQKAYYRFLLNEKVPEKKLIDEMLSRCSHQVKGKVVLSIQDTTEINLTNHRNRLKSETGLGGIDYSKGIGFKLHPSLVVDAGTCFPLGFSSLKMWSRGPEVDDKTDWERKKRPLAEKESHKWIEAGNKSKETLSSAATIVIIQDREGDIFSQFQQIPDQQTHLLIRSRFNRNTEDGTGKLWETLRQSVKLGNHKVRLDSDSHGKTPAREANIEVRSIKTSIKSKGETSIEVYAVEAFEIANGDYEPVHWGLLTTWPVITFEDALLMIEWYTWRWFIEELFRMLKKEGFNIEGSELETGWSIRKLTVMLLDTVIKLMQMHIAYNEPEEANAPDASWLFSEQEQECIKLINRSIEGKTTALKNPFKSGKLNYAVWVLSRIGGWKGYASQRKPGMTTMFNGLKKFYNIYQGWVIQKDVGTR